VPAAAVSNYEAAGWNSYFSCISVQDGVYVVNFNSQGGSAVAPQGVVQGEKAVEPAVPTRTEEELYPNGIIRYKKDYIFGGWYKEANCANAWNFATDVVTLDTTLYAKWMSNYLASLSVSNGTLSPAFNTDITYYTVSVPYSVSSFTITATAADANATVAGAGVKTLNVGDNVFDIVVTAENGSTKTYTLYVTREANSNNNLASLSVSSGTLSPVFNADTTYYTVSVPYSVSSLTITAITADATATVVGAGAKMLNEGGNMFDIVVTAENNYGKTYQLYVTRQAASSNNNLASLSVSSGTLSPAFNAAVTNYTCTVANSVSSLTITATAADATATVAGAGVKNLNVGSNMFQVVVTAQNGNIKTYVLTVTRQALSSNNNLASLSVSSGTLSPMFNAAVINYTCTVANSVSSLTITATAADATATVAGAGVKNLNVGSNAFQVVVTAQNGSTKTYVLTVTRQAEIPTPTSVSAEAQATVRLYPNPVVNGQLTMENEQWKTGEAIEIYNLSGALSATYTATGEKTSLNISHLPNGTYLLKVGGYTAKFVKQ